MSNSGCATLSRAKPGWVATDRTRDANRNRRDGGDRRDRTDDLKLAKLPLSQLSYVPYLLQEGGAHGLHPNMVGLGRVELPTSRLSSARSNQLSYRPKISRTLLCNPERKRNVDGGVPQMGRDFRPCVL
jgi:hypothetical protein